MKNTDLKIVYIFDDGAESDIALGTIDSYGIMSISKIADGQEETVNTMVHELNSQEKVYYRDVGSSSATGRVIQKKTAILRGAPGFLEALQQTVQRFYHSELRFDISQLDM